MPPQQYIEHGPAPVSAVAMAMPLSTHPTLGRHANRRVWPTLDLLGGYAATKLAVMLVVLPAWYWFHSTFFGTSWSTHMGEEAIWLLAAIVCAPLMKTGIQHIVTLSTTVQGIIMDWPELGYASWGLIQVAQYGAPNGIVWPVAATLAVGIAEELFFRVLILGWLVTRMRVQTALLASSIIFAIAHLQEASLYGLIAVIPQFSGGLVLGAIYLRTRNPLPVILCHAFWDLPFFLAYGVDIAGGGVDGAASGFADMLPNIAFAVYGVWLVRYTLNIRLKGPQAEPFREIAAES